MLDLPTLRIYYLTVNVTLAGDSIISTANSADVNGSFLPKLNLALYLRRPVRPL